MTTIAFPYMRITIGGNNVTAESHASKFFRLPDGRPVRAARVVDVDDLKLLSANSNAVAEADIETSRECFRKLAEDWFFRYYVSVTSPILVKDNPKLIDLLKAIGGVQ